MTTTLTLREKLGELLIARDHAALADTQYKEAFDAWLMEIGEARDQDRRQMKERVAGLETEIRATALAEYAVTKEKRPCPGIEIKMNKVVGFSPGQALDWARVTKLALIPASLDERKYERFVLSGDAPGTIQEEPAAYIAWDLAKALKGD